MPEWLELAVFLIFAIPITFYDIKEYRIPDVLTFGGIAAFVALKLIFHEESFAVLTAEIFAGFAAFWLIRFLSKGKMGLGDAKYSAFIAVAAGMLAWFATVFIASVIALIAAVSLIGLFKMDRKTRIPFAPFLTIGASLAILLKDAYNLRLDILL
jgi:prepilin signal peptidase PulO-like enzyme (type II secretory pathway)